MGRRFGNWMAALEARHLADPARAGSHARAARVVVGIRRAATPADGDAGGGRHVLGALDSAGKRAAFALFYAPLHFIAVTEVVRARGGSTPPPKTIVDLGMRHRRSRCGMGARVASPRHRSSASIATRGQSMKRSGPISSSVCVDARVRATSRRAPDASPRRQHRGGLCAERVAGRRANQDRRSSDRHRGTRRPRARDRADRAGDCAVVGRPGGTRGRRSADGRTSGDCRSICHRCSRSSTARPASTTAS